jgi:hypothetical protein
MEILLILEATIIHTLQKLQQLGLNCADLRGTVVNIQGHSGSDRFERGMRQWT